MSTYTQLRGKYLLSGQITCLTGLHIGGTTTGVEIGGLDNPVIKNPMTDEPYIPGSSLKGKLRAITEWSLGLIERHPKHGNNFAAYDCRELEKPEPQPNTPDYDRYQKALTLGCLYGAANDKDKVREATGPSRLIVRDAFLSKESRESLQDRLGKGLFTEVKTENSLDRVTSEANPRPIERVPADTRFDFFIIVDVYDSSDTNLMRELFAAMRLLEHSSLGGSGSRGHGEVKFENLKLVWRSLMHYRQGNPEVEVSLPGLTVADIVAKYTQVTWPQIQ